MTRVILKINLLIVAIFVSGCATIVTGKYQSVTVTSDPPGAKVSAGNGTSIITPGTFKLARNQYYTLIAEYPGAEPQQKKLKRVMQGWFWGNILIVSCTGCAVDLVSGSAFKFIPDKVHFDFAAAIAAASRKRLYLQIYPDIIDQLCFTSLNELYAKDPKEPFQANIFK